MTIRHQYLYLLSLIILCMGLSISCGRDKSTAPTEADETTDPPSTTIRPSDPPYTGALVFPSGLRLDLVQDANLTGSYPNPSSNPFGGTREKHYARVSYFIDLPRAPISRQVALNFLLSEYVATVQQRGDTRAYIDAQIVDHIQQVRSGLGRPLIINSAYRSPEHNQDVGGANFSRHIYGDAADIDVDQTAADANQRAQEIFNEAQDVGIDFVLPLSETSVTVNGQQRVSWVHVDDRGF